MPIVMGARTDENDWDEEFVNP